MSYVRFNQIRSPRHGHLIKHWKVYVDNEEVGQFNLDVEPVYHLHLGPVYGQFKTSYQGPAFCEAAKEACRLYQKQYDGHNVTESP